ncbi:hypothetical protein [Candidatus Macondimonas diazotrophica]|uniref:Uncharacterized protein n=1 Tax=Candidatus Macondimonas diazotrophica TaxID=2305248 RepID=A0A4Z0F7C5_9GAMM|nr:hypothetical protein [Candidatus Macondimonas diazotrophica]TFZ81328.1 hypothetical protein E4680_12965 [Candidatus Macondimonas diazotrophica]
MMYGEGTVKLKRAANGFVVCFSDPEIVESNKKKDKYEDPEVDMVFTEMPKLIKFLQDNLEKLLQEDEYDTAFMKALKE